jgi:hypothetical protein
MPARIVGRMGGHVFYVIKLNKLNTKCPHGRTRFCQYGLAFARLLCDGGTSGFFMV